MSETYTGEVCWFNNKTGYGFISWKDENNKPKKDIFLHFSDIVCEGFKTVNKGQRVQFKVGLNRRGEPKAIEVVVVK